MKVAIEKFTEYKIADLMVLYATGGEARLLKPIFGGVYLFLGG